MTHHPINEQIQILQAVPEEKRTVVQQNELMILDCIKDHYDDMDDIMNMLKALHNVQKTVIEEIEATTAFYNNLYQTELDTQTIKFLDFAHNHTHDQINALLQKLGKHFEEKWVSKRLSSVNKTTTDTLHWFMGQMSQHNQNDIIRWVAWNHKM